MRLLSFSLLIACAEAPGSGEPRDFADPAFAAKYAQVCADGETTQGIDVSYWQSGIDWASVHNDGVDFAVIRVSHGLGTYDTRFPENWAGAKANGVRRGVYQYFSGSDDPTAQAQLLLDEMGPLEEGDLPPVLDVESGDNEDVSVSQMNANVTTWMNVVYGELGVMPMIYAGAYSWTTLTGDADFTEHPLWTANWTTDCPMVPNPWTDWTYWQYSSTGSISGIGAAVDLDVYNGSPAALEEWAYHPLAECSGTCLVAQAGDTVIEEDDTCACGEGSLVSTDGHDGHAYTTSADEAAPTVDDAVTWQLRFERAGTYDVSLWVPALTNLTTGAVIDVTHDGVTDNVAVNERSVAEDWLYVGAFHFSTTGTQTLRLGDAYEDAANAGRAVSIDALKFTLTDDGECDCAEGDAAEEQDCSDGTLRTRSCDGCDWTAWSTCEGHARIVSPAEGCACESGERGSAGGRAVAGVLMAIGAGVRRGKVAQRDPWT